MMHGYLSLLQQLQDPTHIRRETGLEDRHSSAQFFQSSQHSRHRRGRRCHSHVLVLGGDIVLEKRNESVTILHILGEIYKFFIFLPLECQLLTCGAEFCLSVFKGKAPGRPVWCKLRAECGAERQDGVRAGACVAGVRMSSQETCW